MTLEGVASGHVASVAPARQPCAADVVEDLANVERVREAWSILIQTAPPTVTPEWIRACAETLGYELATLVVSRGSSVAAALPLGRRAGVPGRLEAVGVDELAEPTGAAYADPDAMHALAAAVARQRRPVLIRRMFQDEPLVAALRTAFAGRGVVVTRPGQACPYIELDEAWQEPERRLSARRGSDLRRARRRAEQVGPVATEFHTPAPGAVPDLLDAAFAIEARSWKGRAGSAVLQDPKRGRFYRRYAIEAARSRRLQIAFLRVGEQRVATQVAVESADALWLLKIGYDESYARVSPGLLMTREAIADAAARGLRRFEFLGTPGDWTRAWTRLERPCVAVGAYPFALRSVAAAAADAATVARRKRRKGRQCAATSA